MKKFIAYLFLFCCVQYNSYSQNSAITVTTYNIRYASAEESNSRINWENRKLLVEENIRSANPDILSVQEALKVQMEFLSSIFRHFTYVGVGRDDGDTLGEYSAIFIDTVKFSILNSNTFWLSETPGKVSKGWDAMCKRVVTWAELKVKNSSNTFFVFNTHFDHMGTTARIKSAKLLSEKVKNIAEDKPVIITGDFNFTVNSEPYKILSNGNTGLFNSRFAADIKPLEDEFTFNGFTETKKDDDVIDFIFVNSGIKVKKYIVFANQLNGQFPSDHNPVSAVLKIQ